MKKFLSLLLIGSSSLLVAQSTTDSKSWIGIKTKIPLAERLYTNIGIQHRSKSNFKELDKYFFETDLDYDLNDDFSLELGLRLEKNNDTNGNQQGLENKYRLHWDLNYKRDLGSIEFKSRVRYQINDHIESQGSKRQTLRLKNSVEININNWTYDPEFLIEPFITVGDPNLNGVRKWRYGVQTDIPFSKDHKLKFAYFYMTATQFIERQHILGLFYKFDL